MSEHPNLAVVKQVGAAIQAGDIRAAETLLANDVVWHYFNPRLAHLSGDYRGISGIESFFTKVGQETDGTFSVKPVCAHPFGDQLVVVHGRISLTIAGRSVETDVVVVWRVRDGRVTEVWIFRLSARSGG